MGTGTGLPTMTDRFDIAEGYWLYYADHNVNGHTARCRETGRNITVQLHRMGFRPSTLLTFETMSEGAREVYDALVARHEGRARRCDTSTSSTRI